jgi:hypothetical protein
MRSPAFERFAGIVAWIVALGGLGYSAAFVAILRSAPRAADYASAIFLLAGGLLGSAVLVALYGRLRDTDPGFALWALVLGVAGSIGSSVHGGYDLATLVKPPPLGRGGSWVFAPDPRGLLTFGLSALAILVFSWLITRGGPLPVGLGRVGYVAGALLIVIYVGRLTILDPKNPVLLTAALLAGFVVNPLWYLWLGRELRRGDPPDAGRAGVSPTTP